MDFIGVFLLCAGFVLGLGAVTVIDIHGFLGRHSAYWSEATIRTHKVTKPLIWIGILFVGVGGMIFYRQQTLGGVLLVQAMIVCLLIANGCFLSFRVSPFLLKREREGKAKEILPGEWQRKIVVSFLISDFGWWGSLLLFVYSIVTHEHV